MTSSVSGTATDFNDFIDDLIAFVSTDATLVAASEEWTLLREWRDNLASIAHNMTLSSYSGTGTGRRPEHTFRRDNRTLHTDSPINSTEGRVYFSGYSDGVSFMRWQLRTSAEIDTVELKCPSYTSSQSYDLMPKEWRLQYSDDDSAWTTALTVNDTSRFNQGESRQYTVPGTPGSHEYWRIVFDDLWNSSSQVNWAEMLLLDSSDVVVNQWGDEVILEGPGLAGTDEIFVGFRTERNESVGWYNMFMAGYTGYSAGLSFFDQPGAFEIKDLGSGDEQFMWTPMVPLWDTSMDYWISGSGRRFTFGVKVGTVYVGGYLGFFLPYATPSQYPYPLAVGGSLIGPNTSDNRTSNWLYSNTNQNHGVFCMPGNNTTPSDPQEFCGNLIIREPGGEWMPFGNFSGTNPITFSISNDTVNTGSSSRSVLPHATWNITSKYPWREAVAGGYVLEPAVMVQATPSRQVYGELDGVYHISGFGVAPEDTLTYDSVDHIILQNAFRSSDLDFWAIAMP